MDFSPEWALQIFNHDGIWSDVCSKTFSPKQVQWRFDDDIVKLTDSSFINPGRKYTAQQTFMKLGPSIYIAMDLL